MTFIGFLGLAISFTSTWFLHETGATTYSVGLLDLSVKELWRCGLIVRKGKKLYIVLISVHGLIHGENTELGRDSDTGGQSPQPSSLVSHVPTSKDSLIHPQYETSQQNRTMQFQDSDLEYTQQ